MTNYDCLDMQWRVSRASVHPRRGHGEFCWGGMMSERILSHKYSQNHTHTCTLFYTIEKILYSGRLIFFSFSSPPVQLPSLAVFLKVRTPQLTAAFDRGLMTLVTLCCKTKAHTYMYTHTHTPLLQSLGSHWGHIGVALELHWESDRFDRKDHKPDQKPMESYGLEKKEIIVST